MTEGAGKRHIAAQKAADDQRERLAKEASEKAVQKVISVLLLYKHECRHTKMLFTLKHMSLSVLVYARRGRPQRLQRPDKSAGYICLT